MSADTKKPSGPNEATFWRRYSPHHECLLACVGSFTVHALVVGTALFFSLFVVVWARSSEVRRPPSMDVVQLSGGGGEEGGGGDPAPFGQDKFEENVKVANVDTKLPPQVKPDELEIKSPQFDLPGVAPVDPGDTALDEKALKALEKEFTTPMPPKKVASLGRPDGVPKGQGPGGKGGDGIGPGIGNKKGPGIGKGGLGGRPATKQEILAARWRFLLHTTDRTGKEHAEKLDAMGIILAVPDGAGRYLLIRDFKRRPVETEIMNGAQFQAKFKDAVHWFNRDRQSVTTLADELRLPFIPQNPVIMLLPREREAKMAEVEHRFAERRGRAMNTVQATYFDFLLRNGAYEPVVIKQE